MRVSLDEMATFVEVVDSGSFSKAAQSSGVPVSTVSRRVSDLERRLQVQLLHRTTRKQSLTDIGSIYYEHCSRMLHEAEAAELAVQNLQAEPTGVLRVSAPFSLDDSFSSGLVLNFLKKYPKVNIDCVVTTRKVDLIEEKFDCAILPGELEDSSLIARGMGKYRTLYCASPKYIEKYGTPTESDDLSKHHLIHFETPPWVNFPQDGLIHQFNTRFQTNDFFLARRFVIDGLGIARLPEANVKNCLKRGEMIEVLPKSSFSVPLNIVFPSNKQFTTKLRAFIDHMVEYSLEHAPWDFS